MKFRTATKTRVVTPIIFMLVALIMLPVIANAATEVKVLFLGNNTTQAEFPVVESLTEIEHFKFEYTLTQDKNLPQADPKEFDILWLGQGEICENGYLFTPAGEKAVLAFAEGGGVVINVEQDSDDAVIGCGTAWLPEQLNGSEQPGTDNFEPTKAGDDSKIFTFPEKVNIMHCNDKWHNESPKFTVLATDGTKYFVLATLPHGEKGLYIVTALQNESAADAESNRGIITNILYFAAMHRDTHAPVEATGKLAMTWAEVKVGR